MWPRVLLHCSPPMFNCQSCRHRMSWMKWTAFLFPQVGSFYFTVSLLKLTQGWESVWRGDSDSKYHSPDIMLHPDWVIEASSIVTGDKEIFPRIFSPFQSFLKVLFFSQGILVELYELKQQIFRSLQLHKINANQHFTVNIIWMGFFMTNYSFVARRSLQL